MWGSGSLSNIEKENVCAPLEIKARFFIKLHFFYVQKDTQAGFEHLNQTTVVEKNPSLPCEVLISSLIEMESTMNESTIGKCSSDFNDMIALTQNHLLLALANSSVLPSDVIFVKQPEIKKTRR